MIRSRVLLLITAALLCVGGALVAIDRVAQTQVGHWSAKLELLASLRAGALQSYFDTVRAEVTFWGLNSDILAAQAELVERWETLRENEGEEGIARLIEEYTAGNRFPFGARYRLLDAGDGSAYSAAHKEFHGKVRPFVKQRGYYDFFLISPTGDIVYTVEKEADFGTNLVNGKWAESGLGQVFARALKRADLGGVAFSDMAAYGPSQGDPAVFAATALVDELGDVTGVVAVQVPLAPIQAIMQFTAGMGETGETYLVGQDKLMRSQSRFAVESTILSTNVDTATVRRALVGESGVDWTSDYRDVPVLSAFQQFQLDDVRWAVMAEIDRQEVFRTLAVEGGSIGGLALLLWILSAWTVLFLERAQGAGARDPVEDEGSGYDDPGEPGIEP